MLCGDNKTDVQGGLVRLAACGPVGPASRWAATSNVEVGQTTYPVYMERDEREGQEWSEGQKSQRGGEGTREGGALRPLATERWLQPSLPRVYSYATADGARLPTTCLASRSGSKSQSVPAHVVCVCVCVICELTTDVVNSVAKS